MGCWTRPCGLGLGQGARAMGLGLGLHVRRHCGSGRCFDLIGTISVEIIMYGSTLLLNKLCYKVWGVPPQQSFKLGRASRPRCPLPHPPPPHALPQPMQHHKISCIVSRQYYFKYQYNLVSGISRVWFVLPKIICF